MYGMLDPFLVEEVLRSLGKDSVDEEVLDFVHRLWLKDPQAA